MRFFISLPVTILIAGMLAACVPTTFYSPDIAKQSGLSGRLSSDDAVAIIRKKATVQGSDADYGSFKLDSKGFRFDKTTTVKKQMKVNGQNVEVEYEETRAQQVSWTNVSKLTPYLSKTIIGDRYIVMLDFVISDAVSGMQPGSATDLDLYCKNYHDLTEVTAALQTLIGK